MNCNVFTALCYGLVVMEIPPCTEDEAEAQKVADTCPGPPPVGRSPDYSSTIFPFTSQSFFAFRKQKSNNIDQELTSQFRKRR